MAITASGTGVSKGTNVATTQAGAMAMVTTLFFMWGFLTCLNDIISPHLQSIFELNYFQAAFVQAAFFLTYFVVAVPGGKIVELIGYKKTMVVGLLTMALGALLFVPAASVPSFPFFLVALVVLAAGVTALQVSANPYVSILGPERTASSRLNLTQAFNSLGTTIAPYFGSVLILAAAPKSRAELHHMSASALQLYRQQEASTVKLPYIGIGLTLILLALAIAIFKLPKIETTRHFRPAAGEDHDSIWKYRHLVLGALAIFIYVGAEVSIGNFLAKYFNQPDTGALPLQTAAKLVSFYWGGAMIGRFIGAAVLQRVRPSKMLGIVAICASLLAVTSMLSYGHVAIVTILLVGLFNSIMFPTIFTLAIAELGPLTGRGSGLLIAAIVGGALIPLAMGALADRIGIHHSFVLPAICYLYIAFYGFSGSHPMRTT